MSLYTFSGYSYDYMGVNYFIVWDVAKNIIPTLTGQIESIINSYKEDK